MFHHFTRKGIFAMGFLMLLIALLCSTFLSRASAAGSTLGAAAAAQGRTFGAAVTADLLNNSQDTTF